MVWITIGIFTHLSSIFRRQAERRGNEARHKTVNHILSRIINTNLFMFWRIVQGYSITHNIQRNLQILEFIFALVKRSLKIHKAFFLMQREKVSSWKTGLEYRSAEKVYRLRPPCGFGLLPSILSQQCGAHVPTMWGPCPNNVGPMGQRRLSLILSANHPRCMGSPSGALPGYHINTAQTSTSFYKGLSAGILCRDICETSSWWYPTNVF